MKKVKRLSLEKISITKLNKLSQYSLRGGLNGTSARGCAVGAGGTHAEPKANLTTDPDFNYETDQAYVMQTHNNICASNVATACHV